MSNIGDNERKTQERLIKFFVEKLHYTYLGDLRDIENTNIKQPLLNKWLLSRGYSAQITDKAVSELLKTSSNLQQGLYHANKETYSLLKYGAKVKENPDSAPQTVYFVDFKNPEQNNFYIAEEVTVIGKNTKRPDLR